VGRVNLQNVPDKVKRLSNVIIPDAAKAPVLVDEAAELPMSPLQPSRPVVLSPPTSDREVLVRLYHATDGPNWDNNTNWLSDAPLSDWNGVYTDSDWKGVSTDVRGRVHSLFLGGNNLRGSIPPELGNLTYLQDLSLDSNSLTGHIPPELGNLAHLQSLTLYYNNLTGHIPPELGDLAHLQDLRLFGNNLTGPIPAELGNLTRLTVLALGSNNLSGPIPPELGNLAHLRRLGLRNNDLTGPIPPGLFDLPNLERPGIEVDPSVCVPKKQVAKAIELRLSAYECELDGRLLPSALIREDSNGVAIALPEDLHWPSELTVSDRSVAVASVVDGWLELTPRSIGTTSVELFPSDGGAPAVAEVVVRPAVGTFGIDIVMDRPAPLSFAEALMTGADWWSRVLDGTEWPDRRAECPAGSAFNDKVKAIADDLLILAEVDDLLRSAGGFAETCFRSPGTQVALDPGGGILTAAPDVAYLHLVVHEIGHILGLVLWGPETGLVSEDGAYFIGPLAIQAFRAAGGDPDLPGVPIDGSHWRDDVGYVEVKDGYSDRIIVDFSPHAGAISLAALEDAGYTLAYTDPAPPAW